MPFVDFVHALSYESHPKCSVRCGTRLFDSALGAIYFAEICPKDEVETKANGLPNGPTEYNCILKTIDLKSQNIFAITKLNKRTTIRGLSTEQVLYLSESKTDAKTWMNTWASTIETKPLVLAKVAYLVERPIQRDGAEKLYRCNEFLTEAIVGLLLDQYLPLPNFVSTKDAWIRQATGFILQEYAGTSLYKNMAGLSLDEFKSVIMQTLVALSIAQDKLQFKHHDVHLENIFVRHVKDTETFGSKTLRSSPFWSYTLTLPNGERRECYIRHCGLLAKFGDYGLASITDPKERVRYERVDMPILDATEIEWGSWNGSLENCKSYDALVLLSKFFLFDEITKCPKEHVQWAQGAYQAIKSMDPTVECSNIGRPFRNREGRLTIAQLLQHPYFQPFFNRPSESHLEIYHE
jgi:hypothetical protein